MKREIKFRAWDPVLHRFASAYDTVYIESDGEVVIIDTIGWLNRVGYDIQLFTGLKDKNGKEIYEGDVVRTETEKAMMVSWNVHFASFCLDRDGWMFAHYFGEAVNPDQIEVIGNIYENPELLNQ